MAQRPSEPQALNAPDGKSPGFDRWLFLFYKWVTSSLAGLFPGTAGNVIYSDGAGGVANEDAFNYNATTNALAVGSVSATTTLTAGTTVTAGTGITSTTGNIVASAGNITATLGAMSAGTTVTAGTGITATTGNVTATAGNFVLTAGYLDLAEIADPGYAAANHALLHAEDVAGITQVHHNTSGHKWVIGQDNWIVARNVTGAPIPALRAVYISGSTGARPQITMADADDHNHAVGVTQDTIADNGYGAVVVSGYVKGVDTSGWVAGDALYLSGTAGVLTTTIPTFPATKQRVATVIYSHATQGIIQVFHHEDVREGDGTWETPFSIGDGATAGEIRLLEPSGTQYTAFKAQAQAGNVTYILPAADATVAGYALKSDAAGNLSWGTAGGSDMKQAIAQAGHGFTVGELVYHTGSIYDEADYSTEATAEVIGIVSAVADVDNFTLLYGGYITGLSGLTAGTVYFLGAAGALTATEPTTAGYISKPVLIAVSTTTGYFFNMRGQEIGGGVAGVREITSGTATAGQTSITATYTPGYVDVYVNGVRLLADDYVATSGSAIVLDTGMALNDEWVVVVWNVVALAQIVAPTVPGGRLTLAAATPVMATEQAAKQTVYYTPYVGDLIPIYDGTAWSMKRFSELSMAMAGSANWAINSNYDLYVYNDGGTLRLGTGAAWTSGTARNESLTMLNGIYVNTATMTLRYGASSTVSVAASSATYVGTMRTTGNTGETTWELGGAADGGDPIRLYVWNTYNRVLVSASIVETANSWTYAPGAAGFQSQNASTSNRATFVRGVDEDGVAAEAQTAAIADATSASMVALGLDATNAYTGYLGRNGSTAAYLPVTAGLATRPGLGMHFVQALDGNDSTGTAAFRGDNGSANTRATGMKFTGMF